MDFAKSMEMALLNTYFKEHTLTYKISGSFTGGQHVRYIKYFCSSCLSVWNPVVLNHHEWCLPLGVMYHRCFYPTHLVGIVKVSQCGVDSLPPVSHHCLS